MKLLFNKADKGQEELKARLGFLDADIKYKNLEPDIELNMEYLIQFIGQEMYDKLVEFYESDQTGEGADQLQSILKNAQLYVLILAYLDYAPNNDLVHGNSGRKVNLGENEKHAWDWQIRADNGALKRRSYKALDRLIRLLDQSTYTEWKESDQYKKSKSLFLSSTSQFQDVFPHADNSGQLYYQLVPLMADIETETLRSILGTSKFDSLKTIGSPTAEEKELIRYCQKITAFRVLERANELLPEEMLENEINYKLSETDRHIIQERRTRKFESMAEDYELELQRILARQNSQELDLNPIHGIQPNKNHVNL